MEKPAKKPLTKKWWFWAIIAVVLIGAFTPKGGDKVATAPTAVPLSAAVEATASQPTALPTPIPTPEPTPEPFDPIVLTGKGDDVATATLPSGVFIARIEYVGNSNFSVWTHVNGNKDLTVNEIGSYKGTHVLWGGDTTFEVGASGPWTIEIDKANPLPTINVSGHGDTCPGYYSATANDSGVYEISHSGDSNFSVWMYTNMQTELLVNEIGEYSGKKLIELSEGEMVLFQVTANDDWSISRAS